MSSFAGNLKRKDNSPMEDGPVHIDSSDSESEGFLDGSGTSSVGSGKASKETAKPGKKSSADNLKTGGKTSIKASATKGGKGDWGKGGKGYAPGKASGKCGLPRASAAKPLVTEEELKLELDIPENSRVLMDGEAASLLQGIQDSFTVLSDDPNVKMPESFNKVLQYCKARNNYTDIDSVRRALESLKEHGLNEGEICMIGNECPETVDEVYALVPSLRANKHKNERPIREVLVNLAGFMHS